jgi:hypothetical protein
MSTLGHLADIMARSRHVRFTPNTDVGRRIQVSINTPSSPKSAHYALPSDLRGAHTSKSSPVRSKSEGSSFSGLFTL